MSYASWIFKANSTEGSVWFRLQPLYWWRLWRPSWNTPGLVGLYFTNNYSGSIEFEEQTRTGPHKDWGFTQLSRRGWFRNVTWDYRFDLADFLFIGTDVIDIKILIPEFVPLHCRIQVVKSVPADCVAICEGEEY